MSAGPIKEWRDAHKPPRSQPQSSASHAASRSPGRAYCGRRTALISPHQTGVTCADCIAALAADSESNGSGS